MNMTEATTLKERIEEDLKTPWKSGRIYQITDLIKEYYSEMGGFSEADVATIKEYGIPPIVVLPCDDMNLSAKQINDFNNKGYYETEVRIIEVQDFMGVAVKEFDEWEDAEDFVDDENRKAWDEGLSDSGLYIQAFDECYKEIDCIF